MTVPCFSPPRPNFIVNFKQTKIQGFWDGVSHVSLRHTGNCERCGEKNAFTSRSEWNSQSRQSGKSAFSAPVRGNTVKQGRQHKSAEFERSLPWPRKRELNDETWVKYLSSLKGAPARVPRRAPRSPNTIGPAVRQRPKRPFTNFGKPRRCWPRSRLFWSKRSSRSSWQPRKMELKTSGVKYCRTWRHYWPYKLVYVVFHELGGFI